MNKKSWLLEKNLERFDNYIEKADNKASFTLAFGGAVLSFLLVESENIVNQNYILQILILVSGVLIFINIVMSLLTILPRKSKANISSCFDYETIENKEISDYKNIVNTSEANEYIDEMFIQTKELARICSKKMFFVRWAVICLGIALGLLFIAFIGIYT